MKILSRKKARKRRIWKRKIKGSISYSITEWENKWMSQHLKGKRRKRHFDENGVGWTPLKTIKRYKVKTRVMCGIDYGTDESYSVVVNVGGIK